MTKKEKLIDSAQKNIQKGQIAKAIKDYQQLVELEPKDIRHRQKLAELYNRAKQTAQALEEYHKVGNYYADNGFYLKAIAVFKQIQRISPDDLKIYIRLADLNVKQGLIGNAMAEYRQLIARHEQTGETDAVIDVLRRMKAIDPENLNIRVKLGETLAAAGMKNDALEDFQDVLKVLQAKGDQVKLLKLHEIFARFFPGEPLIQAGLGMCLIRQGKAERGIALLETLQGAAPEDPAILDALACGHHLLGAHDQEQMFLERLAELLPGDLDARERLVRACLAGEAWNEALGQLEAAKADFLESDRLGSLRELYETLRDRLPEDPRVGATLQTLYELSGEGAKLFGAMAGETAQLTAGSETIPEEGLPPLFSAEDDSGNTHIEPALVEESEEMALEFLESLETTPIPEKSEDSLGESPRVLDLPGDDVFADLGSEASEAAVDAPATDDEPDLVPFDLDSEELSFSFDDEPAEISASDEPASLPDFDPALNADAEPLFSETSGLAEKLEEAGFLATQGRFDEAESLCRELLAAEPGCRVAEELLDDIRSRRQAPAVEAAAQEDFFDFGAEILDELGEDNLPSPEAVHSSMDRYGMDGVFSEFKKGVRAQIDSDDAESHFNLGIAYKEMGLLDDAIGEFEQAMNDSSRCLDCVTLIALCQVEKGDCKGAETTLKLGLALPGLNAAQRMNIHYDLGQVYELVQRPLEALECFQNVHDVDMFYRDVQAKIHSLRQQLGFGGDDHEGPAGTGGGKNRVSYI
ncbi:MAG: tetratricopeptide repeat protein [Trichloromonas sp.]|nr:tetratricopeptide repeat protein [Trichloromonas sp.]